MHILLQLEYHGIVHDVMNEVDKSVFTPGYGREGAVIAADYNFLAPRQLVFPFCADVPVAYLFRSLLEGHFGGLVERSQQARSLTLVHNSDIVVIEQPNSPFSATIQKRESVEQLDRSLYNGDKDETTAVIQALCEEKESVQHYRMHRSNFTKKVAPVLDLVNSDQNVGALVSRCIEATDVSTCNHIFVIALDDLDLVVLLRVQTPGERQGGFSVAMHLIG